jgi:uncharacterized protein (DUF342 family)
VYGQRAESAVLGLQCRAYGQRAESAVLKLALDFIVLRSKELSTQGERKKDRKDMIKKRKKERKPERRQKIMKEKLIKETLRISKEASVISGSVGSDHSENRARRLL